METMEIRRMIRPQSEVGDEARQAAAAAGRGRLEDAFRAPEDPGRLGWEVHSAMTVSGGLALLDLRPDAVILDLMLPDGDGMEVLRKVRAEKLETKVAVTTGIEDRVSARRDPQARSPTPCSASPWN